MTTARSRPVAFVCVILRYLVNVPHCLTDLLVRMANQVVHNMRCLNSFDQTQMLAHQKNAELLDTTYSDTEAPEEEISDLSSDEDEIQKESSEKEKIPTLVSTAQNQLFDGLQFYLAVSQVREHTVRSVLTLGMTKTLATLKERRHDKSIAVIEQRYPDFTCFPIRTKNAAVQPISKVEQPPLDLLAALQLSPIRATAHTQSCTKVAARSHLAGNEEGRARRPSLSLHGPNISRVA
ncbi:uncharacterized protein PHALS_03633 [Plasmopara halstedii]|uniref:Uncharacterized protein n=1 Tax=Plasmopara halstedii TaxID=4781 RepID=A0A0P1AX28_PLAHL|nr:uncharacterized protein PHALS_03633 [Plasmopara halstedii]CEG46964.1 hypothetical protein PHALS_03633 [Plasmopara halstedii]|eukprot:XP_024583333.1 hypothetical protein PHALS_03633 [Plasmopara halstedii]